MRRIRSRAIMPNRSSPDSPMSLQAYLAFVAACIALALLPGPVVTLVIANGLRHGTRAALTNIAGAQAGLADRDRHRRGRPDLADGDHGLLVRLGALCRRGLSGLARHQADPLSGRRRQRRRAAAAAARRLLPAGLSGAAVEPEGAGVLRRVHSAVHGHEQGSLLAGGAARRHLHGDRAPRPTRSTRCWPAARGCSSRRGGRGCCRASPAAS